MIYVHVGFPKTATTTIQRFMQSNVAFLKSSGYVYPALPNNGEERMGVGSFAHNALGVEMRRGNLGINWQRLLSIIDRHPDLHFVLSAESLTGSDPNILRAAFGDRLVTIICYIRQFSQILQSQYAHLTKLGVSVVDFDEFFEQRLDRAHFDLPRYFAKWSKAFGSQNIRVRMLDKKVMKHGDVRFDFLDAIDLAYTDPIGSKVKLTSSTNEALGWKTIELLREANRHLRLTYFRGKEVDALKDAKSLRQKRLESPLLDFSHHLSAEVGKVGVALGHTDKGDYLTRRQKRRSNKIFDRQVTVLSEMSVISCFVHTNEKKLAQRPFLPTFAEISHEEISDYAEALKQRLWPVSSSDLGWPEFLALISSRQHL